MIVITFTPIPDKAFTVLSGFVGAPFLLFAAGFLVGRAARFTAVAYLVHRFGGKIIETINRYSAWAAVGTIATVLTYVIVRWHLLPW